MSYRRCIGRAKAFAEMKSVGACGDRGYSRGMRSLAVALLALLALAAVVGCGSETDEAVAPSATVTESTTPQTTRETAPALSGVTLDGDAITLGDFRGRPVLINVWSSW